MEQSCPVVQITGWLFHGTETSGLMEILEDGGIRALQHDELDLPGFCTSTDDRVLMAFSSQEGSGLQFYIEESSPLIGIELSDFYHAILACENCSDFWNELVREDPSLWERAESLGLLNDMGTLLIGGESVLGHHPASREAHALCLPGWKRPYQGPQHARWCLNEHEVCILQNGCLPLWEHLTHIIWEKEEISLEEALERLAVAA